MSSSVVSDAKQDATGADAANGPDTSDITPPEPARKPSQRNAQLEHRCQRFVEVAEELFLQNGFAGTSVNKVVAIAGGSLATLYAEFRNKDELFEAVMKRRASRLFLGMVDDMGETSIEAMLDGLGQRLMDFMLSEQSLGFYRLVVNEGPRFPGVRNAVLQNGWTPFFVRLAERLQAISVTHGWKLDDPRVAAELFVTLIQGQLRTLAAWGLAEEISAEQRRQHVERSVRQFLAIYPTH